MCSSNLRLAKPTDMTTVKDGGFYRLIKHQMRRLCSHLVQYDEIKDNF